MDKVEIYYFTGSGNSLYVAKELEKHIPGAELIPLVRLLSKDRIVCNAETVGFVFPNHGMTVPIPVKNFIEKAELDSARYIFAVATRGGTKCFAFDKINKLLRAKGKELDSYFSLNMASNDPKFAGYEIPTEEKLKRIEADIGNKLDNIGKVIINKEKSQKKDKDYIPSGYLLERLALLGMLYAEKSGVNDYFYSDSRCMGCGTCEKVCPSQKIRLIDNKPVWQNNVKCFLCYACINYCPVQASQIKDKWYMKSYTPMNGRYPHPYATVNEISGQKQG
jgi:ferredoxin